MNKTLKIIVAAAEVTPIAKVGGLGDVIGALPKALNQLGVDVRIIMPFYGTIARNKYQIKLIKQNIKTDIDSINLWRTHLPGSIVPVYLIEHNFFHKKIIYSNTAIDCFTDINKFAFFSRAILSSLKAINFIPDVIHLNDWHTAALAKLLKTDYKNDTLFKQTKILYTIHNLANQGTAKAAITAKPHCHSTSDTLNYMAEAIINADLINTVSPAYAKEILTKEYGEGLEKILVKRKSQLYGILNGLDIDFFNPQTDKLIKYQFSLKSLEKKKLNKIQLRRRLGLPQTQEAALVGLVTRFVWQKGVDLITEKFVGAIQKSPLTCQFVLLGKGEKKYEKTLLALAKKFPNQVRLQTKFDEKLAHQIYAASDIFLVPSRFEPCGLTQMIAMRYGSIPLARLTGGLKDTVNHKVGFTFKKFTSAELYKTLIKALTIFYHQPKKWRRLQLNCMNQDFSWDKSAKKYLKLYKKLIK